MNAIISRLHLCLLGSMAVLVCLPTALRAQVSEIDAARKEGSVVVYGTVVPQSMQINGLFEKKYGVRVEYWRADSTNILDRALTEWRAGRPGFDVIEGSRAPQNIMKKEGLFVSYTPPSS